VEGEFQKLGIEKRLAGQKLRMEEFFDEES
jgi:hypothetical protein